MNFVRRDIPTPSNYCQLDSNHTARQWASSAFSLETRVILNTYGSYHKSKVYLLLKCEHTATQQTNIYGVSDECNDLRQHRHPGYFANIATAARQLFDAIFAVQPAVSQRNTEETIWWLNSLANDCERHSLACPPNCATSPRAANRISPYWRKLC
jgi:hypothetical protein